MMILFFSSLEQSGSSALLIAARQNSLQSMSYLITAGARMNDVNADGLSPLMWAAWNNHEQGVEILLKNGASPTLKDRVSDHTSIRIFSSR
jgi:ankyrin repeat protein